MAAHISSYLVPFAATFKKILEALSYNVLQNLILLIMKRKAIVDSLLELLYQISIDRNVPECGGANQENRIVGGQPAGVNRYPWMARLVYDGTFHCGASLLTKEYVLTAAHCVRKLVFYFLVASRKFYDLNVFIGLGRYKANELK